MKISVMPKIVIAVDRVDRAGTAAHPVVSGQQRGRGGPPPPPLAAQQAAPIDLTGYWVSVVTEDWRWRMATPPKRDYQSLPLNQAARRVRRRVGPCEGRGGGAAV